MFFSSALYAETDNLFEKPEIAKQLSLFFYTVNLFQSQPESEISVTNIEDRWFGEDKLKHCIISAGMSIWLFQFFYYQKNFGYPSSESKAIYITAGFGLGKEVFDLKGKKTMFSFKDLTWDIIGISIGYFLYIQQIKAQ